MTDRAELERRKILFDWCSAWLGRLQDTPMAERDRRKYEGPLCVYGMAVHLYTEAQRVARDKGMEMRERMARWGAYAGRVAGSAVILMVSCKYQGFEQAVLLGLALIMGDTGKDR